MTPGNKNIHTPLIFRVWKTKNLTTPAFSNLVAAAAGKKPKKKSELGAVPSSEKFTDRIFFHGGEEDSYISRGSNISRSDRSWRHRIRPGIGSSHSVNMTLFNPKPCTYPKPYTLTAARKMRSLSKSLPSGHTALIQAPSFHQRSPLDGEFYLPSLDYLTFGIRLPLCSCFVLAALFPDALS